jgi:hypothetical protein
VFILREKDSTKIQMGGWNLIAHVTTAAVTIKFRTIGSLKDEFFTDVFNLCMKSGCDEMSE